MKHRVAKFVISAGLYACSVLCDMARSILKKPRVATFTIIYYHCVPDERRAQFARQMDLLLRVAVPVGLERVACEEAAVRPRRLVVVTFDDAFHSVFRNGLPELAERGIPSAVFVPSGHLGRRPGWITDPSHEGFGERVMLPEEVTRCRSELVTIGSHTVSHRDLRLLDEQEARKEMAGSRRDLESLIGNQVRLLAFPYGSHDQDVARWAKEAGYLRAFSGLPGFSRRMGDEFLVGRIGVSTEDWPLEFRLKILGAYRWLSAAVSAKRKVRSALRRLARRGDTGGGGRGNAELTSRGTAGDGS
jgi:peptidoglycan/xylan/chitin deacetylase (PgdA/CDA1 family)